MSTQVLYTMLYTYIFIYLLEKKSTYKQIYAIQTHVVQRRTTDAAWGREEQVLSSFSLNHLPPLVI